MTSNILLLQKVRNGFLIKDISNEVVAVFEQGNELEVFRFIEKHFGFNVIAFDEETPPTNLSAASATNQSLSDDDI